MLFPRYFRFANPVCPVWLIAAERSVGELKNFYGERDMMDNGTP